MAAAAACSEAGTTPRHVTVALSTDLALGDELSSVRVEVLGSYDDQVLDRGWLGIDAACADGSSADHALGTLQVETGSARSLRLRVTAYRPRDDGKVSPFLVNEVRIPNDDGATFALDLARACEDRACASGKSCDPVSGACVPVAMAVPVVLAPSSAHCATLLAVPPDLFSPSDITATFTGCASDSAADCASACVGTDCIAEFGEACGTGTYCAQGLTCAQGVCCERDCDGVCERCDVSGSPGLCQRLDFSQSDDHENCGACNAACGSGHAFGARCEAGNCAYQCQRGWADCTPDRGEHDGCEQDIANDPQHCGACGFVCQFPFCHDQICAVMLGQRTAENYQVLDERHTWGGAVALTRTATALALGAALRNVSQPGAHVRFALYEADAFRRPLTLRAQTLPVDVVEYVGTEAEMDRSLTVAPIPATTLLPGTYWILVETDKPIEVMSEGHVLDLHFEGPATGTEPFTNSLMGDVSAQPLDVLDFVMFVSELTEV